MKKDKALYPGSFDPLTLGHTDIITRASRDYNLTIGIAANPGKNPVFSIQERTRLIQRAIVHMGIDPSQVVRVPASTARYMRRNGIYNIIRGKRDTMDEIAEAQLDHFNRLEFPGLETQLYDSDEGLRFASSSAAKTLIHANHDPRSIISLDVEEALKSRLLSQYPVYITGCMGAGKSTISKMLQEQARAVNIPIKRIELDTVAHDIYTTFDDPYYAGVRQQLRATFGDVISPDGNWIDKKILRKQLSDASGKIDKNQLKKLDAIIDDAIEFRYKDMIEGFRGIILIDGIMKGGNDFARLAHQNIVLVNANINIRIQRLAPRYTAK